MGSIPIFGWMNLGKRIARGYAALARAVGGYAAIVCAVAVVTVAVVVPLWLLAERAPRIYSALATLCLLLLVVVWIAARTVNAIRRVGVWRWLKRGGVRIAIIVALLAEGYGIIQPIIWIKLVAAGLLFATIGVLCYQVRMGSS